MIDTYRYNYMPIVIMNIYGYSIIYYGMHLLISRVSLTNDTILSTNIKLTEEVDSVIHTPSRSGHEHIITAEYTRTHIHASGLRSISGITPRDSSVFLAGRPKTFTG